MKKQILAIDDESSMLEFYGLILAEFGEVRTALNLEEARKKLPGADLIILDFYLQNDNEKIQDVVPELRKVAPVLLCSGVQEVGVQAMGVALGMAGYWNKGADHDALRSLVKATLQRG